MGREEYKVGQRIRHKATGDIGTVVDKKIDSVGYDVKMDSGNEIYIGHFAAHQHFEPVEKEEQP